MAAPAAAAPYVLTNGTGPGRVTIGVDGFGAFGYGVSLDAGDAFYQPVGDAAAARTVFLSALKVDFAPPIQDTFLSSGTGASAALGNPAITGTASEGVSRFLYGPLRFQLDQVLEGLFDASGQQTGSRLQQTYTIRNIFPDPITFDLTRYVDADLRFDGGVTDVGGYFVDADGRETLFQADPVPGVGLPGPRYLGVYGEGGAASGFEVGDYEDLYDRVLNGRPLRNQVSDIGDVAVAFRRSFSLTGGATVAYTTYTVFGSGTPGAVAPPVTPPTGAVPEPAAWMTMILGFGLAGGALRRRRAVRPMAARPA